MRVNFSVGFIAGLALLLTACLSKEDNNMSRFSLYVTDAPVDGALEVVVQFSGVEVHRAKGTETINFAEPIPVDLVKYRRGLAANLVDYVELPAGDYDWLRLTVDAVAGVDDTYIVLADGTKLELQIPQDAVGSLKIISPFTLTGGGSGNFTIDFDLRRSIHQTDDGYELRPALRLVDNEQSGGLYINVDSALLSGDCTVGAAIYVFSGTDITPSDISGAAGGPLASAYVDVALRIARVDFLPAGTYTVALTCDGELDEPDQVDVLTFVPASDLVTSPGNIEVLGGRNLTYFNFVSNNEIVILRSPQ